MAELSIDTASELSGLALTDGDALISELTWRTKQNHSRELLPALEWLLMRASLTKADLTAVFVCTGPGSYAGLRVGLTTAKTLAYALGIPVAGVGRLAADAMSVAAPPGSAIVAVHAAGRAEQAWARYEASDGGVREVISPRLSPRADLAAQVKAGDIVCGEIGEDLRQELATAGAIPVSPLGGRVAAVARLGWRRLQAGDVDSADALVPLYLREPAIGPQPPR